MVGMVEQHFVQGSPIKYLATLFASREVFFFFGWQLFVFVEGHFLAFVYEPLHAHPQGCASEETLSDADALLVFSR
jgi:hypothetical protein